MLSGADARMGRRASNPSEGPLHSCGEPRMCIANPRTVDRGRLTRLMALGPETADGTAFHGGQTIVLACAPPMIPLGRNSACTGARP